MSKPNIPANSVPSFTAEDAFQAAESASALVNQFIVSPLQNLGIGGLVFDIEDTTTIDLDNDITDHYVETNSAVQDNAAVRPDVITLTGFVGELVWQNSKPASTLQKLTQKITTIASYLPTITAASRQAYGALADTSQSNLQYFSGALDQSINLYNTFKTLNPPKTKQAKAFNYFRALRNGRTKLSIDTPYSYYPNVMITRITASQKGDSKYISDFSVTFKQIRNVSTTTKPFDPNKFQGRTAAQTSPTQNQGKVGGQKLTTEKTESTFSSIFNSAKKLF